MIRAAATLALAACQAAAAAPVQEGGEASGRLTLEACFELERELRLPRSFPRAWMPDGERYLALLEDGRPAYDQDPGEEDEDALRELVVVGARSGEAEPLFDRGRLRAALAALPGVGDEDAQRWSRCTVLDTTGAFDGILFTAAEDLFFWRIGSERAVRLTHDADEEVGESLSPDGSMVAYIHDYDLHVVPTDGGTPLALTRDGNEDRLHGRLDWVYQEELYGRGNWKGFWWSPDSRRLAYLILDESPVPAYTIVDHREVRPEVEVWRYPKAGDPNPVVSLAVVDAAGGEPQALDLSRYAHQEILISRVGWTPDGASVVFQVQDRIQTWLDLCLGDPGTGEVRRLFRDGTGVWIEPDESPHWLPDGQGFVWRSERDGWAHLYLYERPGELVRRLTEGAWEVDGVHGVDDAGRVWFDADRDDVKGSQLYTVSVEGGEPRRVSRGGGTHRVSTAPDFGLYVDSWSSAAEPGRVAVHAADGEPLRTVLEPDASLVDGHGLVAPELVTVPTRDGFEMEAMLLKPPGFDADPGEGRRWPVLSHVYGGPHAPQVRDAWPRFNGLFHQMLAQEGYVVWVCDNRSASGKGLESVKGVYRDLGRQELADQLDGLDWLVAQGWADPERIGIWGWSYGGYMTAYALTHSDRYAMGVSGAPVTDWRLYDTIYTERYMGTPQANPEGYEKSSVLEAAADLSGELLLIHGTIDENVHLQNSMIFAERLQEAGKAFQLMLYPGNRHHVDPRAQREHLYRTMADFVRENL